MSTVITPTELRLAKRMARLGTETAFETLAKARALEAQGRNIIHLEIGEPDFDTPANVIEAGVDAIHKGYTHYTPAGGLMPARQAVADWIRRWYEVDVKPEQVVMVPGSKNVLLFTMLALVDQGDEVIIPDPGYPIYASVATLAGGIPIVKALRESLAAAGLEVPGRHNAAGWDHEVDGRCQTYSSHTGAATRRPDMPVGSMTVSRSRSV